MKITESRDYNPQFPERFNYGLCDSIKLSEPGMTLAQKAIDDTQSSDRNLLPGLRFALHQIALVGTIDADSPLSTIARDQKLRLQHGETGRLHEINRGQTIPRGYFVIANTNP